MTYDEIGSEKSNMVASEAEVPSVQLKDKIGTKFQRHYLCSGAQLSNGIGCDVDRPNRKWEVQNGGL